MKTTRWTAAAKSQAMGWHAAAAIRRFRATYENASVPHDAMTIHNHPPKVRNVSVTTPPCICCSGLFSGRCFRLQPKSPGRNRSARTDGVGSRASWPPQLLQCCSAPAVLRPSMQLRRWHPSLSDIGALQASARLDICLPPHRCRMWESRSSLAARVRVVII